MSDEQLARLEATLARIEGAVVAIEQHAMAQGRRLELLEDAVDEVLDVLRNGGKRGRLAETRRATLEEVLGWVDKEKWNVFLEAPREAELNAVDLFADVLQKRLEAERDRTADGGEV